MTANKTRWLLSGLLCLALWPTAAAAQSTLWEANHAAGIWAYQRGDYAEAEERLEATVEAAKEFGPLDSRLAREPEQFRGGLPHPGQVRLGRAAIEAGAGDPRESPRAIRAKHGRGKLPK